MMKNIVLGVSALLLSIFSVFCVQINNETTVIPSPPPQFQTIFIPTLKEEIPEEVQVMLAEKEKRQFQEKYSTIGRQPTEAEIRKALGIKEEPVRQKVTTSYCQQPRHSSSGAASTIWNTLISNGYNSYAAAGIMGNIMAEVGGQSFDIQYWLTGEGGNYYGICQWSTYYFPEVYGTDLATQLNYLINSVSSGLKSDLNNAGSPSSAAYIFASRYERCASWSYEQRQSNAERAYYNFA